MILFLTVINVRFVSIGTDVYVQKLSSMKIALPFTANEIELFALLFGRQSFFTGQFFGSHSA